MAVDVRELVATFYLKMGKLEERVSALEAMISQKQSSKKKTITPVSKQKTS